MNTSLVFRLRYSIALILWCGVVVNSDSNDEQNVYTNAVRSPGSKAKKIQIVYIKVPLSKVLESPNNGFNSGERGGQYSEGGGFNEGGGGGEQSFGDGSNGIPGEGRPPNYRDNNIGGNNYGGGFGDNSYASNQNSYDTVKPNAQENYAPPPMMYGQQQEEATNIGSFVNSGQKHQIDYQNDANLGTAYGAAVGNALPQTNFDDSGNYGQENQNSNYGQTNQINGYEQNNGYPQPPNPQFNRPQNEGYEQMPQNGEGYGEHNYDKRKIRKGNQHFTKMMANFRPQLPIMTTLPMFSMKGLNSQSFSSGFPSFAGQSFGGNMGTIPGISGISGISGFTGSMKGFGGIKNKLSMLLGNKFGMGGAGALLGGMMGWD